MHINILEYKNLVHHIISKYNCSGVDPKDLLSHGMIGLIKAKENFDESRGVKFNTYAYFWVKKKILSFLEEQRKYTNNVIDQGTLMKMIPTKDDNTSDITFEEVLGVLASKNESFSVGQNEFYSEDIESYLSVLNSREKTVIKNRFGFNKNGPMTLSEIGKKINLTGEAVRLTQKKALAKIKNKFFNENKVLTSQKHQLD